MFSKSRGANLFDGQLIPVTDMPRSYVPTLFALQLPELMLALGLCGDGRRNRRHARAGDRSTADAGRRAAFLSLVLAVSLPILITVVTRPYIYNGVRHLVFVLPPFAVLGGLAAAWIAPRLAAIRNERRRRRAAWHALPGLRLPSSTWCGCILTNTPTTIILPAA